VYEGLYLTCTDKFKTKGQFIKVWRNEAHRVFSDRLLSAKDVALVNEDLIPNMVKTYFKDVEEEALANPLLFADFMKTDPEEDTEGAEDPRLYEDFASHDKVKEKMDAMLEIYNEGKSPMNLVLFNDALEHLIRIHRILRFPKGCGLLIGFGGSGKQSLTKLATFVAKFDLFTIKLMRGYKEPDFREDLRELYRNVLRRQKTFMFTDSHVQEEGFLELINNILTIGMVPSLFPEEEKESLLGPIDLEIKKRKLENAETKEFRWSYFVKRAREQMHIMLCMSPAGETLKVRARSFPGLVNNSYIDWFFPWP
jgi:dynein heavy chain